MRLHRNLVFAVIDGLLFIFNEGAYADKVVEKLLKRDKRWGARDRAFIAETIYEIVRWKRLYESIAEVKAPFNRSGLFRIFAVWAVLRGIPLPVWKQLEPAPARRIKGKFDQLSAIRKFRESVPDWMDDLGAGELGVPLWTRELAALNEQAAVVLRANRLKSTREELATLLEKEAVLTEPVPGYPDALKLRERSNVFTTDAFQNGYFEVQDASSQLVAPFLEAGPGQRVIDACAGAGGKTLHLAALMQNKGQLIALDIYENKLRELKRRARRGGAHNIEPRAIDGTKVIKKLAESADRVLIDAPCSGLGVLRRNPDAKWKLTPDFMERVRADQQAILRNYSNMVKPGGKLVYATCSILPSENEKQVSAFLASGEGQQFRLETDLHVHPSQSGFDGFYMARMHRSRPT